MPEAVDEMEEAFRQRRRADSARYRERHPDRVKASSSRYYRENIEACRVAGSLAADRWRQSHPAGALLHNMRPSAKAKGLDCTITVEELKAMLEPMTCALTGWK